MSYSTKQQQVILHYLEVQHPNAISAADLAEALRHAGNPVGLATIYRQLEKLVQSGAVHRFATDEGALYQYCPHQHDDHACFLVRCACCGRIAHLDCVHLESLQQHLAEEHSFRLDPRQTVLTGICGDCAGKEAVHEGQ